MCQAVQRTFPHLLGVLFHPETALRIEGSISLPRLVAMKKQDQEGLVTGLRLHSEAGIGGVGLSGLRVCFFLLCQLPMGGSSW